MTDAQSYLCVSFGVLIAVVLPVLVGFIKKQFPPTTEGLPPWAKKYGGLLLFSLVTALPCLAIFKTQHPGESLDFFKAFLLGFGWESAIEKFLK
jgi:hypothetical protein